MVTTEHSHPAPADTGAGCGRQAILDDIDRTREQLGETIEALAAKADVQAQAKRKAAEAQAQARQRATEVAGTARRQASRAVAAAGGRPQRVAVAVAAGAALLAGLLVIRKLRR